MNSSKYIHDTSNKIKDEEIALAYITERINNTEVLINKKIQSIDSFSPILVTAKKKAQAELRVLRSSITTDSNYCKQLKANIETFVRDLLNNLQ